MKRPTNTLFVKKTENSLFVNKKLRVFGLTLSQQTTFVGELKNSFFDDAWCFSSNANAKLK